MACSAFTCSVHSCAYTQWLSPASAQAVTSGISSSGKLRGDVSLQLFSDM